MRYLELAPFAVTSDGSLFINVAKVAMAADFEAVVRAAENEQRAVFIGVMLTPEETELAMTRLDNAADDTAVQVVRQRRTRGQDRNGSGE